jgi:hypothetical protein
MTRVKLMLSSCRRCRRGRMAGRVLAWSCPGRAASRACGILLDGGPGLAGLTLVVTSAWEGVMRGPASTARVAPSCSSRDNGVTVRVTFHPRFAEVDISGTEDDYARLEALLRQGGEPSIPTPLPTGPGASLPWPGSVSPPSTAQQYSFTQTPHSERYSFPAISAASRSWRTTSHPWAPTSSAGTCTLSISRATHTWPRDRLR